jgi:hypothetical protein
MPRQSTPTHPLTHVLWLQITLSRCPALDTPPFAVRLRSWLVPRRLLPMPTTTGIAVLPIGGVVGSFDRGLVIGWLVAQPEVIRVRIERRPCSQPSLEAWEVSDEAA